MSERPAASAVLLDVNFLVALAWPNHVHHPPAHRWFRANAAAGWATCSATEAGFVRVSSNRKAIPGAAAPLEAIELLERMAGLDGHRYWQDDVELARLTWIRELALVGHAQISDLHLVALAQARGGRVATFDRGVEALVPRGVDPASLVELVSARME